MDIVGKFLGTKQGLCEMSCEPWFCIILLSLGFVLYSVPNYKTSQEFRRVEAISSLIKIIERNIKVYDIKLMCYENITNKESNGT